MSLKKIIVILLFMLFTASNLLMPYANFDDTQSLLVVYNTCLATDADMNVLEFIGEKLLRMGFEGVEDDDENLPERTTEPINTGNVIQIQSGAMYQQPLFHYVFTAFPAIKTVVPQVNAGDPSAGHHPAVFHPPAYKAV